MMNDLEFFLTSIEIELEKAGRKSPMLAKTNIFCLKAEKNMLTNELLRRLVRNQ